MPGLAALSLLLGAVLTFGAPARTSSPSFAIAAQLLPIRLWGALFLLAAAAVALLARRGWAGILTLHATAGLYAFWALAFTLAALADPRAALTGAVVYGWLTGLHLYAALRLTGVHERR